MRTAVVWALLAVLLAALGGGAGAADVDVGVAAVAGGLLSAVTAAGCVTSRFLLALRRGRVVVDANAAPWRPWRRVLPAALVALVVGAWAARGVAVILPRPFVALLAGAWPGVVLALAVPLPTRASATTVARASWLVSGALAAGLLAGVVGGVVGFVRFAGVAQVPAGALTRLLAGTGLTYTLLGLGGFQKAFSEAKAGVVVVPGPPIAGTPGPFFAGFVTAVAVLLLGPVLLPPLSGHDVVAVKTAFGALCGASLSLLGAVAGHRVAVWGRSGVPPPTSPSPSSSST